MRVRRVGPGDEPTVRSLRIAALTDSPEAFGSTLERELARTPDDWTAMVGTGALFVLEDDDGPAGLVGGLLEEGRVDLVSLWVAPAARGRGGGDALVRAVLDWAGPSEVRLWVVDGDRPARRLYERHGFVPTGERWVRERDGMVELALRRTAS